MCVLVLMDAEKKGGSWGGLPEHLLTRAMTLVSIGCFTVLEGNVAHSMLETKGTCACYCCCCVTGKQGA